MLLRGLALIVGFVAGVNLALGVPGIMRRLHPNPDGAAVCRRACRTAPPSSA
jgi:hypothetical protein